MNNEKAYWYKSGENLLEGYDNDDEKLEKIKKFIRSILLKKNLHLLLGSGCSIEDVDLMSKTFTKVKGSLKEEVLGDYSKSDDIEKYLNWLMNAMAFYKKNSEEYSKYFDAFECTKEALFNSMPQKNVYFQNTKSLSIYQNFYNGIFNLRENSPISLSPLNIFTTNYDLFNEYALDNVNINYTLGFEGSIYRKFNSHMFNLRFVDTEDRFKNKWNPIKRTAKLYKLHGSVNWIERDNDIILTDDITNKHSAMVYPTFVKNDITNQTPYSELFREFSMNLQKPQSVLIVIGFGFPDEHINNLITQALANEDFILVIFGENEKNTKLFYDKNKSLTNIHLIGGEIKINEKSEKINFFQTITKLIMKNQEEDMFNNDEEQFK